MLNKNELMLKKSNSYKIQRITAWSCCILAGSLGGFAILGILGVAIGATTGALFAKLLEKSIQRRPT